MGTPGCSAVSDYANGYSSELRGCYESVTMVTKRLQGKLPEMAETMPIMTILSENKGQNSGINRHQPGDITGQFPDFTAIFEHWLAGETANSIGRRCHLARWLVDRIIEHGKAATLEGLCHAEQAPIYNVWNYGDCDPRFGQFSRFIPNGRIAEWNKIGSSGDLAENAVRNFSSFGNSADDFGNLAENQKVMGDILGKHSLGILSKDGINTNNRTSGLPTIPNHTKANILNHLGIMIKNPKARPSKNNGAPHDWDSRYFWHYISFGVVPNLVHAPIVMCVQLLTPFQSCHGAS